MNYPCKPTIKQLIAEVRRLAAEKPDYVYESAPGGLCLYNERRSALGVPYCPACIFGQAFLRLGFRLSSSQEGKPISDVLASIGIIHDEQQREWITVVQSEQDTRTPWGKAVRLADRRCRDKYSIVGREWIL